MSERLSNDHGHDAWDKTPDPASPAEPGDPAETPDPRSVPANEGGEALP
jgi:hypothetical protein